jgi:hypothetical protein
MDNSIVEKVIEQLHSLPYELQWRVLEFIHALSISEPRGIPGRQLMRFEGKISIDDVKLMSEAIEKACEQVDINGW